eukprot:CAMPEP_0170078232 /NCGR_PEP_ID=MMETSP0019_2-20121128/14857_1 /TAXON_ID=98059 /ORGANISM="Dinobryon sp., Strain UTEXLB2267" /LENGTH=106 /DNA_ID=CAMNT_0010290971 /DNA_START=602 /DNA_END=925 /DNA_ORIENTATION=+
MGSTLWTGDWSNNRLDSKKCVVLGRDWDGKTHSSAGKRTTPPTDSPSRPWTCSPRCSGPSPLVQHRIAVELEPVPFSVFCLLSNDAIKYSRSGSITAADVDSGRIQ